METIRNYLENMFLNLPNTPEVYKAKNELWQMNPLLRKAPMKAAIQAATKARKNPKPV